MSVLMLFSLGLILFLVAIGFLACELFVPSHGILACISGLIAMGGIVAMFKASPVAGVIAAVACVSATPCAFFYFAKVYPTTPMGKRVMLAKPKIPPATDEKSQFLASLPGKDGIAVTLLRPVGAVEIEGRRVDCVAESEIIPSGTPVRVQRVMGTKVIVAKI